MTDDECTKYDDCVVIRGDFTTSISKEVVHARFEQALDIGVKYIVIEPEQLGETISHWLTVGNCLYNASILAGFGSIVIKFAWPSYTMIYCPMATLSLVFSGIYSLSWQSDPCCSYRVVSTTDHLDYPREPPSGTKSWTKTVEINADSVGSPPPSLSPPLSYTSTSSGASDTPKEPIPSAPKTSSGLSITPVVVITKRSRRNVWTRTILHTTVSIIAFTLSCWSYKFVNNIFVSQSAA